MDFKCCKCGNPIKFSCKVSEGDEIWACTTCKAEYIYNAEQDCLYLPDRYNCC